MIRGVENSQGLMRKEEEGVWIMDGSSVIYAAKMGEEELARNSGEKALVFSGSLSPAARGLLEYDSARSAEERWETGTERRPILVRRPLLPPPARRKLRDPRAPGASQGGALPVLVGGSGLEWRRASDSDRITALG